MCLRNNYKKINKPKMQTEYIKLVITLTNTLQLKSFVSLKILA